MKLIIKLLFLIFTTFSPIGEVSASSVANASGNILYGAQDGRWYTATPLREITVSTTRPNTVLQSIYRGQQEFMNSPVTQGVIGVLLFFTPVSYEAAGAKIFGPRAIDGAAHVVARDGVQMGVKSSSNIVKQTTVHGNSLKSTRPTWGYKLYSNDGTFLKNGITSQVDPLKRYTQTFMSDKYMIPVQRFPNRIEAWNWELQQNLILRGPLNKSLH